MIEKKFIFPAALALLNLGAALMAFLEGNWRMGVYWMCSCLAIMMVSLAK